jgi:hypothetical protein
MNELIAVDPVAPSDIKDVKAMFDCFGLTKGRFIALYPEDWLDMFRQYAANLEGLDRSRFIRLLDIHRDAFLDVSEIYGRAKSWQENAVALRFRKSEISNVLATDPNKFNLDTLSKFLWDRDVDLDASRGAHIPMQSRDYVRAVSPLFQHSSEVHLADPFFSLRRDSGDFDRRRGIVLKDFLIEAEKTGRIESFVLHLKRQPKISRDQQEECLLVDLNEILKIADIRKVQVEYALYDKMKHGRYIFSIKGGMQFDHGFDQNDRETNHVHWLSSSEILPIYEMYGLA